ncbi:MAG: LysM peptidoglycan-binding domain-containing protein [Desulfuromonadaceae bacterium]|nr:LysM peptidoglycan-binding domain-containing protein [Desulfuromonadaceae bacterium]MDD2855660.1 LysM peptidoglycan-binding domain-containing protein [Desulfuromonadaceae bacterium]
MEGFADSETSELFPREYRSLLETFEHGEALYKVRKDDAGADVYFRLAFQKASVLEAAVLLEKKRRFLEQQEQIAELSAKAEQELLMRAAAEAEMRLVAQQLSESKRVTHKKNREPQPSLTTTYTVRPSETLPQISARKEIYNDSTLWPIIYRSNRDQIRNPKRLWPGQVLVIPRNFSRDEAVDARRFSSKK